MTPKVEVLLMALQYRFNDRLAKIQATATANFRTLARSTGQNMRVDRVMK